MTSTLTFTRPDDWHLHVRDGAALHTVVPHTAAKFGRAIIMPNLVPPVTSVEAAIAYRERLMACLPAGSTFRPLMTCYLTDHTVPDEVERGFREGVWTGVKIYPANATTNSAAGVTDITKTYKVLERMEKIGMRLLIHGEEVAPDVDVFDREAVFIERRLIPMTRAFPGLKIILEHLSSEIGVQYILSAFPQVGSTITPYHLMLNRTMWLGGGLRPYMYCMPVIKKESDRLALRKVATAGHPAFFLGTDSAPHPVTRKLAVVGAAGLFNSPVAIESYAKVFEEDGALDKLEAFAALNGPAHYGLPPNEERITLEKQEWSAPEAVEVDEESDRALVYRGGEKIEWKVVAN